MQTETTSTFAPQPRVTAFTFQQILDQIDRHDDFKRGQTNDAKDYALYNVEDPRFHAMSLSQNSQLQPMKTPAPDLNALMAPRVMNSDYINDNKENSAN